MDMSKIEVPERGPVYYGGYGEVRRGHLPSRRGESISVAVKTLRCSGREDERIRNTKVRTLLLYDFHHMLMALFSCWFWR